ncbi:hypothetical protein X741_31695 [Mesorhizobium sp. LNHC229A00]|nr:hypothetical protein X741_31695 [Mesorhizobium sp. LNHC229A00]
MTHSGVTIAPHLGKVVADEVVRGKIHEEMEMLRPQEPLSFGGQLTATAIADRGYLVLSRCVASASAVTKSSISLFSI